MQRFFKPLFSLPVWAHAALTAVAFSGFQWIKTLLDASYAASNHPVDYATGQTTFDATRIKEFYAHMQAQGSLDVYVRTQQIDFGFLILLGLSGLLLGTFVARAGRRDSWARRIGCLAALFFIGGALMDASENLVSFVMLNDPQGFAGWLALPYSGFAVVKFALITAGMGAVLISLLTTATGRLFRRPVIG
ncbi:MAG: hypothetical protein ACRBBS_13560 [Thalassovita sp.]